MQTKVKDMQLIQYIHIYNVKRLLIVCIEIFIRLWFYLERNAQ